MKLQLGLELRTLVSKPSPLQTGHSLLQRACSIHHPYTSSASIEVVSDPAVSFNPGKDTVTCVPTFKTLAGSGDCQQKPRRSSVSVIPRGSPTHCRQKVCITYLRGPRRWDRSSQVRWRWVYLTTEQASGDWSARWWCRACVIRCAWLPLLKHFTNGSNVPSALVLSRANQVGMGGGACTQGGEKSSGSWI